MANIRYVNPASAAGGDGTTNATSGANRAYHSLADWDTARQAVLSDVEEVYCETDGTADGPFNLAGWTTSAANYIHIIVSPDHRHAGVWDATKFRIEATNANGITQDEAFVRVTGMQFLMTVDSSVGSLGGVKADLGYVSPNCEQIYDSCISKGVLSGTGISETAGLYLNDEVTTARNCIAFDFVNSAEGMHGFRAFNTGNALTVQNCTAHNCRTGFTQLNATNCGAASCNTGFSGGSQTTCSSTSPQFVDEGNDNFHLAVSDTVWRLHGTDLSGTFTNDIDGETRSGTWDIGADQKFVPPDTIYTRMVPTQRM